MFISALSNRKQAPKTVEGLARGRSAATETDAVKPVQDAFVDATLAHVSRAVSGRIQVQRLTGMRPGEVILMEGTISNRTCTPIAADTRAEGHSVF
jgi:hypothetical protein